MKKRLFITLIAGLFCFALPSFGETNKDTITISEQELIEQTNTDTSKVNSIEIPAGYNEIIIYAKEEIGDSVFIRTKDSSYLVKTEKLPWYLSEILIYVMAGVLLILLICVLYLLFTNKYLTKDKLRKSPVPDIIYHELRGRIVELMSDNYVPTQRDTPKGVSLSKTDIDNINAGLQRIDIIHSTLSHLQKDLKHLEAELDKNVTKSAQPQQQSQSRRNRLFATQDAANENRLYRVSDVFDAYDHTFEITLNQNSTTEGTFILCTDDEIQKRCLKTTDALRCCEKKGTGTTIIGQTPGKVHIDGKTATVTQKAIIHLK